LLNVKQGSCEYQHLKYFGLTLARKSDTGLPTTSRTFVSTMPRAV